LIKLYFIIYYTFLLKNRICKIISIYFNDKNKHENKKNKFFYFYINKSDSTYPYGKIEFESLNTNNITYSNIIDIIDSSYEIIDYMFLI